MNLRALLIAESVDGVRECENTLKRLACLRIKSIVMDEFAPQRLRKHPPDVAIWYISSPRSLMLAAGQIKRTRGCALFWSADSSLMQGEKSLTALSGAYFLPRPVAHPQWEMILKNALKTRAQEKRLSGRTRAMRKELKERKACARAKGILMSGMGLDEFQAEKRIALFAREMGVGKLDAALKIIKDASGRPGSAGRGFDKQITRRTHGKT